MHVRGGHAAGKSHGESHRFSGTGISAAIISPILQDDLEERLSQKSGMDFDQVAVNSNYITAGQLVLPGSELL